MVEEEEEEEEEEEVRRVGEEEEGACLGSIASPAQHTCVAPPQTPPPSPLKAF